MMKHECTECGKTDVGVTVVNKDAAKVTHYWHPKCWSKFVAWLQDSK